MVAFGGSNAPALRNVFPSYLTRLTSKCSKPMKTEVRETGFLLKITLLKQNFVIIFFRDYTILLNYCVQTNLTLFMYCTKFLIGNVYLIYIIDECKQITKKKHKNNMAKITSLINIHIINPDTTPLRLFLISKMFNSCKKCQSHIFHFQTIKSCDMNFIIV